MSKPSDDGPTHGPWRACLDHNGRHEVRGAGSYTVATVFHTPDGRVAANADLISAAPDLYAVLYEMFCEGPVHVAFAGNPIAAERLEARVRAALAKAEGQS